VFNRSVPALTLSLLFLLVGMVFTAIMDVRAFFFLVFALPAANNQPVF